MKAANQQESDQRSGDGARNRLIPNAAYALIQVVVSSGVLFLLYGYLIRRLGAEALGVWTLLMAATSLANISNLGIAGGLVKFVANHLAMGDADKAASAIQTAILTLAFFVGLASLCMWGAIDWILTWIIPAEWVAQARAIVPYSILALWLSALGGAVHSALEGCHRSDLRSMSTLLSQPALLIGAYFLTPELGLKGLAFAQIAQYLLWIAGGWWLLRRQITALPLVPYRWNKERFAAMWRYGVNFQIISVMLILSEPLAKGLLAHYTTLSTVAYFEMANRLIVQAKSLLTSTNQVITPYYAKLHAVESAQIAHIYLRNLQLMAIAASALFATIIAAGPLVSLLWVGHQETQFLVFLGMLCIGWFINSLAAPAYFANLGIAHLGPNVRGHFAIMLGMVIVALLMGPWIKPYGSAMAWPVGLLLGSFIIDLGFIKHIGLSRKHWAHNLEIPQMIVNFLIGTCTALGSSSLLQNGDGQSVFKAAGCLVAGAALLVLLNGKKVLSLVRFNKLSPTNLHPV